MDTVSIKLPKLPKGFEYTGEYRRIKFGDMYLSSTKKVYVRTDHTLSKTPFFLVKSIKMDDIGDEPVITSDFVDYMLNQYLGSK